MRRGGEWGGGGGEWGGTTRVPFPKARLYLQTQGAPPPLEPPRDRPRVKDLHITRKREDEKKRGQIAQKRANEAYTLLEGWVKKWL